MSDAKIRRITKLMNELNADGDVKNTGLESAYVQTTHTGNVSVTGTIQDDQGSLRALEISSVNTSPYSVTSGSSGKFYRLDSASSVLQANSANFSQGDVVTLYNETSSTKTITFDAFSSGSFISGSNTNYSASSVTLSAYGMVTLIAPRDNLIIVSGNVS